jgi:hypothetical protein
MFDNVFCSIVDVFCGNRLGLDSPIAKHFGDVKIGPQPSH